MTLDRRLARGPDQSFGIAHLVHDLVAAIDASRAADALILQAFADIDPGGTDLHADAAIDTVAQPQRFLVGAAGARAPRLAAFTVISDDERVRIEHHALEARVGTHVLANLLAHPAGIAVGRKAVEQDPERFPRAKSQCERFCAQFMDRREIADEGKPGP